jgi:AcrR family transcriptional regulator
VQNKMTVKNSKEIILNQALIIFGQLGFHKTTMDDIANASQKGRRTIYTYFKNKEEVYEAVVEREIDQILIKLNDEIKNTQTIQLQFEKYINSRIRAILFLCKNYDALKIAFVNNYRWVEKIREKLDAEEKIILTNLLSTAQKNKVFIVKDLDAYVKNISLIIKGIELMLIKEDNKETTSLQIKNLQHLLIYGLLNR